jgi:hypothetical protein
MRRKIEPRQLAAQGNPIFFSFILFSPSNIKMTGEPYNKGEFFHELSRKYSTRQTHTHLVPPPLFW